MMKKLLILILVLNGTWAFSQTETFDIATFTPPAGWKREEVDFAASYLITNNKTGGWCRVSLYKSIESSGDASIDFESEWKNIAEKDNKEISATVPETATADGWTATSSSGTYTYNGSDAYFVLTSISGYGKVVTITANMNSEEYANEVQNFLESIALTKPDDYVANKSSKGVTQDVTVGKQNNTSGVIPVVGTSKAGNQGISISTTNFNDGWVAQPFADYVRLVKNNLEVYLYYVDDFSTLYSGKIEPEVHYWNTLIALRFNTFNAARWEGGVTYPPIHYQEGDAIEKQTGKSCFLGMDVFFGNGGARVILVVAPSKNVLYETFKHPRDLEKMLAYNKFAVAAGDLVGTWEESTGSGINMYNSVTGAYAGMSTSSSANKFIFKTADQYESAHSGASGMVGSMKFYGQKYSGKYTVSFWEITATNRFEGKTDVFWAEFEAVRGGRVLHLTDKTASGMKYHLVKTE